jgi:hypothetical protein
MIPIFIHPNESFDRPSKPVPANGTPLSVLILEDIPYVDGRGAEDATAEANRVPGMDGSRSFAKREIHNLALRQSSRKVVKHDLQRCSLGDGPESQFRNGGNE